MQGYKTILAFCSWLIISNLFLSAVDAGDANRHRVDPLPRFVTDHNHDEEVPTVKNLTTTRPSSTQPQARSAQAEFLRVRRRQEESDEDLYASYESSSSAEEVYQVDEPPCPIDAICINYRFCANGIISDIPSGYDLVGPSSEELMEFGTPCGTSGLEVCCRAAPPPEPSPPTIASSTYPEPLVVGELTVLSRCPRGFRCINYRSCANGVFTDFKAGFDLVRPSLQELKEYGTPCGNSGLEVCCEGVPSTFFTTRNAHRPNSPPPPSPLTPESHTSSMEIQPSSDETDTPPAESDIDSPPVEQDEAVSFPASENLPCSSAKPEPPIQPILIIIPTAPATAAIPMTYNGCDPSRCIQEFYCNMMRIDPLLFITTHWHHVQVYGLPCRNMRNDPLSHCCRIATYANHLPAIQRPVPIPLMYRPFQTVRYF